MILVAGATGHLGGLIAGRLLAQGRSVRVLVRPTSDYGALVNAGADPAIGDLKHPGSLVPAVTGVETVITTANSAKRGGEDNPRTVDLEGNANLVAAARAARVRHFVFVSAIGSSEDSPIPFVAAKGATERRVRESGMEFTLLAPTPYMDYWLDLVVVQPAMAGREVVYSGTGENRHSLVAVNDVASLAVAAVDHPAARNQYILIGGPRPFSWREAIASVERALGHAVAQRALPSGRPVPGVPDHLQPLLALLGKTEMQVDMAETALRFGLPMTSLDDWINGAVAAARGPVGSVAHL